MYIIVYYDYEGEENERHTTTNLKGVCAGIRVLRAVNVVYVVYPVPKRKLALYVNVT